MENENQKPTQNPIGTPIEGPIGDPMGDPIGETSQLQPSGPQLGPSPQSGIPIEGQPAPQPEIKPEAKPKKKGLKYLLFAVLVLAAGALGYVGYTNPELINQYSTF